MDAMPFEGRSVTAGGGAPEQRGFRRVLAQRGASVILTDVSAELGESVAADLLASRHNATFITQDVSKEKNWHSFIEGDGSVRKGGHPRQRRRHHRVRAVGRHECRNVRAS